MGRPTDLNPDLQALIVAAVEEGNAGEVAAMAQGVDRSTYYRWMKLGKEPGPYSDFRDAVTRARAAAEVSAVACLRRGMAADPKLAVEFLRRARWKRWEPKTRSEVKVTASTMTDAELDAALEAHRVARAAK